MTPEQIAAQQAYLSQLATPAPRSSNAGYLIGGGLGVLGSTAAAISAQRALNARKRAGVLDIRPEALKQSLGDIALRAKSARVSNYGQRMGNIVGQQNRLAGNAAMVATSPSQLQNMILQGQRQGAQQEAGLAQEGAAMQQQNLGTQRALRGQEANYQDQARREYAQDVESLRNAVWSNINKGVNTAGQAAMMMAGSGQPVDAGAGPILGTPDNPNMSPRPYDANSPFAGPVRSPEMATQAGRPYVMRPPEEATQDTYPYVMAPPAESMDLKQRARYNTSRGALFGRYRNPLGYYPTNVPWENSKSLSPRYPNAVPYGWNGSFPLSPRQD